MSISTERQREILDGTRQNAEEQQFGFLMAKRAQEILLARATASKLRLGQWTPRAEKSSTPNMGNSVSAIKGRLAQLEFDLERLEVEIAGIDEQLAALPAEEDG